MRTLQKQVEYKVRIGLMNAIHDGCVQTIKHKNKTKN